MAKWPLVQSIESWHRLCTREDSAPRWRVKNPFILASDRIERRRVVKLLSSSLCVNRYWYVLHKRLDPPDGELAVDVMCRAATVGDRATFREFSGRRRPDELLDWVTEPDTWLFIAFLDGRPVGYDCVSRHLPSAFPFAQLTLAPDEVWVRDVYTLPAYRRLRVRRTLRAHRASVLRQQGFVRYIAAAAEENLSALIATYDGTVEAVSGLQYTRRLWVRTIVTIADARARLERHLSAVRGAVVLSSASAWMASMPV